MLELRNLSRRYGDLVALDGLSLDVPPGQLVGLLGPNGAGKSAAMRIALGLLRPDSGEVHWRGRAVGQAERRTFGYLPEERGLYPPMRVRDQVVYFGQLHGMCRRDSAAAADRSLEAAIVMWFLLGFGFCSCAYAAAGASVSRAEEVGNATLPLTLLLLAGYLIGISATSAPDTTLARVASFVPPLAPMVMVSRAAVGHVARWEVPLAVGVELVATWVLIRVGGRVTRERSCAPVHE